MATIRIANAPCSWGALEFEGFEGESIAYEQMLDELRDTGYVGTELGDWGYLPVEPVLLKSELEKRQLALLGAFVPVGLKDAAAHADGEALALRTARLLAAATENASESQRPLIILADNNGTDAVRTRYAGRVTPELGLSLSMWNTYVQGAERIARSVRRETGLATAFHHHCAGYVETPAEIARFLEMTDPALIGLVFDTGHYLFGTGSNDQAQVLEGLERFGSRIWHVHFKDCHPAVADRAREADWDYFNALRHGVFCELGQGGVPFSSIKERLQQRNYEGWIVVEQDVLPGMGSPEASARRNREYLRSIGL